MAWLSDGEKKIDDTVIRFDRIHERDRYTDRQTDRHRMAASELDMHGSGPVSKYLINIQFTRKKKRLFDDYNS